METVLKSNSPTSRAFRRFMRNMPAVIGIAVISFSVIIALLGYLVTPDSTADANDQILQITNKSPGFTVKMLKRAKNKNVERENVFSRMFLGEENPYEMIPIHQYHFEGSDIIYEEYTGDNSGTEKKLSLADVVYPVSGNHPEIISDGNTLIFYDFNEQKITAAISELQKKVESENIVSKKYFLGTDKFGRDILSRLIIGVRVSLSVGLVSVIISILIGVFIGSVAGYFRGFVDEICMWFMNVFWAIPTLLIVFALALALGKDFWLWKFGPIKFLFGDLGPLFIAVGLTMWVEPARIIRGQIMSLREMQYVEAARSLGYSHARIIGLHILPNVLGPLMVVAASNFASAILIEAGLSFLGIGVQPPKPTWGGMLSENYGYIIGANPFLAIIPGLAIMLMVLAFNMVGNGLRDALDVRTSLGSE